MLINTPNNTHIHTHAYTHYVALSVCLCTERIFGTYRSRNIANIRAKSSFPSCNIIMFGDRSSPTCQFVWENLHNKFFYCSYPKWTHTEIECTIWRLPSTFAPSLSLSLPSFSHFRRYNLPSAPKFQIETQFRTNRQTKQRKTYFTQNFTYVQHHNSLSVGHEKNIEAIAILK